MGLVFVPVIAALMIIANVVLMGLCGGFAVWIFSLLFGGSWAEFHAWSGIPMTPFQTGALLGMFSSFIRSGVSTS